MKLFEMCNPVASHVHIHRLYLSRLFPDSDSNAGELAQPDSAVNVFKLLPWLILTQILDLDDMSDRTLML